MMQMRKNKGPTCSSGKGNGKQRQKSFYNRGKAKTCRKGWGEMTRLFCVCVKERKQVNSEFDSLVEFKADGLGRTRDKGCDKQQPLRWGRHSYRLWVVGKCTGSVRVWKQKNESSAWAFCESLQFFETIHKNLTVVVSREVNWEAEKDDFSCYTHSYLLNLELMCRTTYHN